MLHTCERKRSGLRIRVMSVRSLRSAAAEPEGLDKYEKSQQDSVLHCLNPRFDIDDRRTVDRFERAYKQPWAFDFFHGDLVQTERIWAVR